MLLSRCRQQLRLSRISAPPIRHYTTAGHDLSLPVQSYLSRSSDPYLNLSIENHLLTKSSQSSTILFLYINRPCVVIGRNQNPWTEVNLHLLKTFRSATSRVSRASGGNAGDEKRLDLVRRRSGGGTVFHDFGNVNWTVVCPSAEFTRDKHAEMVVRALRKLGVQRCRVNERHDIVLDQGGEDGDVKWGPEEDSHSTPWMGQGTTVKVSGSAYKLTRGRALHHGTALLGSENLGKIKEVLTAPGREFIESKGVESVSSPVANLGVRSADFIEAVQDEFGRMYNPEEQAEVDVQQRNFQENEEEAEEEDRVKTLGEEWLDDAEMKKGYDELKSLDWTYCQTPRFTVSNEKALGKSPSMPFAKMDVRGGVTESFEVRSGALVARSGALPEDLRLKVHKAGDWQDGFARLLAESDVQPSEVERLAAWGQPKVSTRPSSAKSPRSFTSRTIRPVITPILLEPRLILDATSSITKNVMNGTLKSPTNGYLQGPSAEAEAELFLSPTDDSPSSDSPPPHIRPSPAMSHGSPDLERTPPSRRHSAFAHPRPDGMRRTSNRVHFAEAHQAISPATPRPSSSDVPRTSTESNTPSRTSDDWLELDEEDYLATDHAAGRRGRRGRGDREVRAPLLTGIEAPSVTVASEEVELEDLMEGRRAKSGLKSAFMNMANSIIGAGIIGQPYALRQAGLVTGVILLIGLTITVDWTIRLLVTNSKLSGANSFQATVQHCFGKSGLIAISVAQWAFAFGGMVAFCIIIGDTIPHVFAALFPKLTDTPFLWLLTDRRAIIVLFTLGISYPLSLYRDIAKLAKASTLALISMLIIIVTVLTQGPSVPASMKGPIKGSILIHSNVFQAIGVISFAFVCHHNSLLIYGSLQKPTMDRFAKVTHMSTGISCIACLAMAFSGYLNFGSATQGNILNNFPTENIMVNIARLCFGLNMLTTLPLEAFVCREVMTLYYFPNEPFDPNRHLVFSTALVVSAMILSLFTCDLGVVFELVGATSACALAYILPPLCYIKLSKKRSWETYASFACIAFGCTVMGISVLLAVAKMMRNEGGAQTCG
ncbi:transmembrane amino acid transporter-like protein [Elsinoe australis]|uniref:Transmembrane amino acid transporter-like protein n=1 Tax=Elsinoe australis TaxID=40998 RepID=A0A4U7B6B0_9PEZI|nr:transmembrane amino acid transporter-like protein [Elsinoe australis]